MTREERGRGEAMQIYEKTRAPRRVSSSPRSLSRRSGHRSSRVIQRGVFLRLSRVWLLASPRGPWRARASPGAHRPRAGERPSGVGGAPPGRVRARRGRRAPGSARSRLAARRWISRRDVPRRRGAGCHPSRRERSRRVDAMSAPRGSAAAKARAYAGILSSESAGVMAMMRQNAKWALAPGYGYGDDDPPGDPLLEEFKSMRRALFTWRDWDRVAPVAYLAPFLHVIRSVETSGPITGCVPAPPSLAPEGGAISRSRTSPPRHLPELARSLPPVPSRRDRAGADGGGRLSTSPPAPSLRLPPRGGRTPRPSRPPLPAPLRPR